jgi:hypothetical protein
VPVIADKLAVRIAGYYGEGQGNEIDRRAIGGKDAFDRVGSIRASVRADPFDGVLVLDANCESTHRRTNTFAQYESRSLSDSSGIVSLGPTGSSLGVIWFTGSSPGELAPPGTSPGVVCSTVA